MFVKSCRYSWCCVLVAGGTGADDSLSQLYFSHKEARRAAVSARSCSPRAAGLSWTCAWPSATHASTVSATPRRSAAVGRPRREPSNGSSSGWTEPARAGARDPVSGLQGGGPWLITCSSLTQQDNRRRLRGRGTRDDGVGPILLGVVQVAAQRSFTRRVQSFLYH